MKITESQVEKLQLSAKMRHVLIRMSSGWELVLRMHPWDAGGQWRLWEGSAAKWIKMEPIRSATAVALEGRGLIIYRPADPYYYFRLSASGKRVTAYLQEKK